MYDIIVIGKGPAGISAAIYGVRAGKKVLVIARDFGSLAKTESIENYYGFENPVTGMELLTAGIRQATRLGVEFAETEVMGIEKEEEFRIKTTDSVFESKTVILSTGLPRKKAGIPNLADYEGRGVGYCAVCDAFFYRNKIVGVAGNSDYAYEEATELLPFTHSLTLYTNGREFEGTKLKSGQFHPDIKIDKRKISRIDGAEKLEKIIFEDGSEALADGLFVAEGTASALDLAYKLGLENNGKTITVAKDQSTNIPGFFAAGDCTGGILQVSVAVGEGAIAGLSAIAYLKNH